MRMTFDPSLATLLLLVLAPLPHGNGNRPPPPPPPPEYGGPADGIKPGGTTASGGTANGPHGGRTSQPPVPGAGGGKAPAGPGMGGPAPGITLTEDFARWLYWWEFNRDQYLGTRSRPPAPQAAPGTTAVPGTSGMPSDAEVQRDVIPALLRALATTRQRDLVTSTLIALARASREEADVLPVLRRFLGEKDQEICEVSALALGILGSAAALPDLAAVVLDTPSGRALTCRPAGIPMRTRAFAGFALGLIARADADPVVKLRVFEALAPVLRGVPGPERDLRVAAVSALGCLGVEPGTSYASGVLCERAARVLLDFYADPKARGDLARAHVPTALARLVAGDRDLRPHCMDRLVADLIDRRENELVRQSCALALGVLARPEEDAVSAALLELYEKGRDARARNFALMALGQIGGARNKARLLALLGEVRKLDRPWVALGLAVLARNADDQGVPDLARGVGAAIAAELDPGRNKNPENRAGLCIALGILRHADAARPILAVLRDEARNDETSGLAALALGLLGHAPACSPLRTMVAESTRRPVRLRNVAEALRLLGDSTAAEPMVGLLGSLDNKEALFALAGAVGRMGDRRCLAPLLGILTGPKVDDRTRSHAATALGLLADRSDLPWAMPYALGINFHACSETLANGAGGVLDIQ